MGNAVIVRDVDELEKFKEALDQAGQEFDKLCDLMSAQVLLQEENWRDERYTRLKEVIDTYVQQNKAHKADLEDAVDYLNDLIYKLHHL